MSNKQKAAVRKNLVKARKAKAAKRKLALGGPDDSSPRISFHAAYLLGKVETLIEFYSASKGLSPAVVAAELGELLRHSEGR